MRRAMVKLDSQRRFDLERSFVESTLGVAFDSVKALHFWAATGGNRQLIVLPLDHVWAQLRSKLTEKAESLSDLDSADAERAQLVRTIASLIEITCAREPSRSKLRLTVSADAVGNGRILSEEAPLVILAAGKLLEIWASDRWVEQTQISDTNQFTADVSSTFEGLLK